jgi:hypothetical protein
MAEPSADIFEMKLDWMSNQGEWDMHAEPSKQGLALADIQTGSYGEIPEHSDNMTGRPRGAQPRPDAFRIGGYSVRTKHEIWLENASFLYEEALQRQWSSATDVPWETIEPLPDDIEQAQCELATFLTEVEFVAGDVPSRWVAFSTCWWTDSISTWRRTRLILTCRYSDRAWVSIPLMQSRSWLGFRRRSVFACPKTVAR